MKSSVLNHPILFQNKKTNRIKIIRYGFYQCFKSC